ncbi:ATP-dependent RNA helicase TDRD9 [Brachionus plicatilis]|uniref:ATP-dependent RNA helicase TDRD9 n=1 Tax=Brachionus plicatilis TaxID=10195 RepID=A0A3M7P9Y6_BRAPC|nr:ATP-dependent RNA helicase TDRD9 [Brachionus plicatilis]
MVLPTPGFKILNTEEELPPKRVQLCSGSKVKSSSHLDSTISETASTISDKTTINSEDEEERGKFLDPERYIIEKGQEFMSYQTIQKRFDRTLNISVHSAIYDTDQSLAARLSDPKFLFPAKVDELKSVEVLVTDVIECAHFWVQIVNQERSDDLSFIHQELNIDYELKKMDSEHIHQDSLCVSHYDDSSIGKAFYRAKVLEVYPAKLRADIIFIDYGNKVTRKFQDLFYLADSLKEYQFQAIECKMVNVRPSIFHNPTGQWTKASNQTFNRLVNDNKFVSFEIVLHGLDQNLAYVNLYGVTKSGMHKDFTELLVESGCAEIMSKTEIDLNLSKQYNRKDFYIPSRESDYMPSRPRYFNEDMAIRQAEQSKNKYYHEQSMLSDQDDLKSTVSTNHSSLNLVQEDDFDENDPALYDGYIEIRGPYSPLECNYTSLLNIGQNKKIKVERDSINYVTLDTDPTNDSCRLLLAHEVTLNQMGNTMILRKTSLMPKLPGLPSICTLLFAPSIELRTDHNETMFTGALCGLGFDEQTSMPIYTDNDIELAFDVQIDVNDIIMINSVRMAINMVIGSEQEVQTWTNDEKNLRILQQKACEKLLRLFLRNRTKIQPTYYSKPHRWNQIRKEDLIDPLNQDISMQNKEMYYTYHKVANWNEDDY